MKPIYLMIALLLALLPAGASGNNLQQQNKQENQTHIHFNASIATKPPESPRN